MMRFAIILSLFSILPAVIAVPRIASADPDDIGSIVFATMPTVAERPLATTQWLSINGVGAQHIAGWLISATVYGVCLTTSIPEIVKSEPMLTTVRLSRGAVANVGNVADLRPWAATIARSVGVVMVSFGEPSRRSRWSGLRIALLPIGPARSAGLSIAGSFSYF